MKTLMRLCASTGCALIMSAAGFAQHYTQTNLVSNTAGVAPVTDPQLINPWGLSRNSGSPWWVSDQATGFSCAPQKPRQFVKWINAGSNSSNFLPFVKKPVPFCAKLKLSCLDFKSPGDATSTPCSSSGNCCGMDCNL